MIKISEILSGNSISTNILFKECLSGFLPY
jgi:hypothetical protein